MKKRIAVWLPGGVGGGFYSQGIPVISSLIDEMARNFDVTVYSYTLSNSDFKPRGFEFISSGNYPKILRWPILVGVFLSHHFKSRFTVLYSFWGFPSGFVVVMLSKLVGIPSVIHLQGGDSVGIPSIGYGIFCNSVYGYLATWAYKRSNKLIALTRYQASFLKQRRIEREIEIIPFGVDQFVFKYKSFSYLPERELRILHVGNITPVKDQVTLLKTVAELSKHIKVHLKMIGLKTTTDSIRRHCSELGISNIVDCYETQPHRSLTEFYYWADIFLLTSLYEGQGVVLAEAASAGCLLAGTNVGLLSDLGDYYGIITETNQSDQLANKILLAIKDSELCKAKIGLAHSWSTENSRMVSEKKVINLLTTL